MTFKIFARLLQAYIYALQGHIQEVEAPLGFFFAGSVAVFLQKVTDNAVDDSQVNLGAAEVGEALELVLQSFVPPKLRDRNRIKFSNHSKQWELTDLLYSSRSLSTVRKGLMRKPFMTSSSMKLHLSDWRASIMMS